MRKLGIPLALVGALAMITTVAAANDEEEIAVLDDCNPATFNALPPLGPGLGTICKVTFGGDVTFAEFLSVLPFGHPAWRNEPSYIKIEPGAAVTVTNEGGERHTFTEVAKFGGGFIPLLNDPTNSLSVVPECGSVVGSSAVPNPALVFLSPGASLTVTGLSANAPSHSHLFQCCIHPWMRAAIKVKADQEDEVKADQEDED